MQKKVVSIDETRRNVESIIEQLSKGDIKEMGVAFKDEKDGKVYALFSTDNRFELMGMLQAVIHELWDAS